MQILEPDGFAGRQKGAEGRAAERLPVKSLDFGEKMSLLLIPRLFTGRFSGHTGRGQTFSGVSVGIHVSWIPSAWGSTLSSCTERITSVPRSSQTHVLVLERGPLLWL